MKRPLALLLAAALAAASVPAEAALALRAPAAPARAVAPVAAPVSITSLRATINPLPGVTTVFSAALAVNDTLPRLRLDSPAGAFAASAPAGLARVGADAAADAPAGPALQQAVFGPAAVAAPVSSMQGTLETALGTLASIAAPDAAPSSVARAFDGSRWRAAPADAPGAGGPVLGPRGPELDAPSARRRPARRAPPTARLVFQNWVGRAAILAGLGYAAWGAMPWLHYPVVAVITGTAAIAVILGMDLTRALRRRLSRRPAPPPVAATRGKRLLASLAGIGLGIGLFGAAMTYQGALIERYHAVMDSRVEASKRESVRLIAGRAIAEETVIQLSAHAKGREVLDALRDRAGVLHLPNFFVSNSQGAIMAVHNPLFNGIYIDEGQITALGWTVEEFLASPELQREFVRRNQGTMLHELTHAGQGRRNPLEREFYQSAMEHEYEAYVNELLYAHERLKADPAVDLGSDDLFSYMEALADLSGYLAGIDQRDSYKDNVHVNNARWRAWRSDLEARWPALRVEGYHLLALRELAQGNTRLAANYQKRSGEAAEAAGLPAPPPLPKR